MYHTYIYKFMYIYAHLGMDCRQPTIPRESAVSGTSGRRATPGTKKIFIHADFATGAVDEHLTINEYHLAGWLDFSIMQEAIVMAS
jgi:hypothetical protein